MIKEKDDHDDKSYNRIEVFSVFFLRCHEQWLQVLNLRK